MDPLTRSLRLESGAGRLVRWTPRAFGWAPPADALAVDATVCVRVEAEDHPESHVLAYVHTRLDRPDPRQPWVLPFGDAEVERIATEALIDDGTSLPLAPTGTRIDDALYGRVPKPAARRYTGRALDTLTRDLGLRSDPHMQDWPLEVADPTRTHEFLAYYDQATDDDVRFDAMALALYSFDEQDPDPAAEAWFDDRLRRDFPLHAHLVRYWSLLAEPELVEEECFRISPQMRRIFWDCLRPLARIVVPESRSKSE